MPRKNPIPPAPPFDPDPIPEEPDVVAAAFSELDAPTPVKEPVPVPEPEDDDRVVTIVPVSAVPPTHHLVVGMGTLAAMSEADFAAKLAVMKSGQERIRIIQQELLIEGEDYGKVKGIARPFLQQPGAEKLANFYGLALRQETKRVSGDGVTTPHLSYETNTFVHLGDFSGPIVAQGIGEANSWEEKYRYRNATPTCPVCGRKGLVKRKSPPAMAGKWSCPTWANLGGCNANFEPNDPRIEQGGQVENTDPYALAETLVQMSAKRSMVAAVRRATGTSGLFTQDDDSPSVRQQSGDAQEQGDTAGQIESTENIGIKVEPGAKTAEATQVQHQRLRTLAREKGLGGAKIAALLERLFTMEVEPTGAAASAAVLTLDANQMGQLLLAMETGEVPEAAVEAQTPDPAAVR